MSRLPANTPIIAAGLAAVFAVVAGLAVITGHGSDALVRYLGLAIPGLVAAAFAERADKAVRNGIVAEKVEEATTHALVKHGVVTRDGPLAQQSIEAAKTLAAQTAALQKLLERNTAATVQNTEAHREENGQ